MRQPPNLDQVKLAVIGLGYVGLPLAVEFGKHREVVGFDIDQNRLENLRAGRDETLEVSESELGEASTLTFSSDLKDIAACNVYIVTVPTPIDQHKQPDLRPLISASRSVAEVLSAGDVVIYESTVYPGATEEDCVPVLEELSGLKFNESFYVGYSPERINPGDKEHRLTTITKVVSGSDQPTLALVSELYASIVTAGVHEAASIKVAEAAKVIENTQRDLNIALINELAIIFDRLGIDTKSVLEASSTKWNFLPFQPGLVGGHCIGVDPYYLTLKAQAVGYHPEIILAGRRLNDGMPAYVAGQLVKSMIQKKIQVSDARLLVLGMTFKENCPDIRNTKVVDLVAELKSYGTAVDVYDPWVNAAEAKEEYGIATLEAAPPPTSYDAVILAVGHEQFVDAGPQAVRDYCKPTHVFYDLKSRFAIEDSDLRL